MTPLTVGVLGAGAVGCYFGARLAQHGHDVRLVARATHADAIAREGLVVRSAGQTDVVHVAATTDVASIADADVVLVTVKSGDTEATADLIATHISPGALVVSLQNGVDNAWRLRARVPNPVVPAVVYVSAEMADPGIVQHNGGGRIVVGTPLVDDGQAATSSARLDSLVTCLNEAGVPCARSADVRVDLWTKLATNCAYNAISALTGLRYGAIVEHEEACQVMASTTDELVAVARADGVALSPEAAHDAVRKIIDVMPGALSSTAQDLQAGRRTEIDHINGYVVRRGRALGIPTPVNQTLTMLVTLAERMRRS
jgi:2-dehydropantoate 2-reductase